MAINSFECNIITGGFNHCDSSWNKTADELDKCFKIYHPVNGDAMVTIDQETYRVESGSIYFLSGDHIVSQKCTSFMELYWLHFVPVSLHLKHILNKHAPFRVLSGTNASAIEDFDLPISKLFQGINYMTVDTLSLPYSFEEAKLHSYILHVVAEILKDIPANELNISGELKKINPSIKLMNDEFRSNPVLEEIAQKSNMAPNYFHRVFKSHFGITPYNYMLKLRMEHAIKMLTTTNMNVKEVAFESGYNNEFYFYRQFKKHYNYSPGKLKKLRPF